MIVHLEVDLFVYLSPLDSDYTPSKNEMLADLRSYFEHKRLNLVSQNSTKIQMSIGDFIDMEVVK